MTCFEKFKQLYPDDDAAMAFRDMCPDCFGIMCAPEWCTHNGNDPEECRSCWNRQVPEAKAPTPTIKDSGTRQQFPTGAVRDIQKGKGRCDLLPLDVVADFYCGDGTEMKENTVVLIFNHIQMFMDTGRIDHLYIVLDDFSSDAFSGIENMLLEVSMHFEEGAEKYGENNWQKGLPVKCYINSAVRHYLKWFRGDTDERHDRAFCWNILCAIWTCKHKPELNEYGKKICPVCGTVIPDGETECPHCRVFTGTPDFLCELEEEYA